jgi:hypothetical protein
MPKDAFDYMHLPVYIQKEWIVVRNYHAFISLIEGKGIPEIISFDHDLADEHYDYQEHLDGDYYDIMTEKTGYHCAKWLIDYCIDNNKELPATILIHSMNPAGSMNIKSLFQTYFKVMNITSSGVYVLPSSRR